MDLTLRGLVGGSLLNQITRALNQAVRRDLDRFPADFMFSLSREEIRNISQIVISSKMKHAPGMLVFADLNAKELR